MTIDVKSKYVVFPVNTEKEKRKLSFFDCDIEVYSLNIRLDDKNPNCYAYIDLSRFIGKSLEIRVSTERQKR